MAFIVEQVLTIKISKLVKTEGEALNVVDDATKQALVEVVEGLLDDQSLIVETL